MRRLTTEAMRAGAIGFSTSRTLNHRTASGDPTPSLRASAHELEMIVGGVADAGKGVVELISDFSPDLEGEFEMIRNLVARLGSPAVRVPGAGLPPARGVARHPHVDRGGRGGGAPHAGPGGAPTGGRAARAPGQFPPLLGLPELRVDRPAAPAEQIRTLRDPAFRSRLLEEEPSGGRRLVDYERVFPLGDPPDYEPPAERSLAATATARGMDPDELALALLTEDGGRGFLFAPFSNYAEGSLDACREMMAHPDTVLGLGDGGAHVGLISDASFPTYALSHWGRDRDHDRFPVAWLVEQLTSRTARAVGLRDRGIVAPGLRADLNVIDFDRLQCERPAMAYDLPAGGKRLLQSARGYHATIVAGQVIARDGKPTGALPGHLVRGPQPDPRKLD